MPTTTANPIGIRLERCIIGEHHWSVDASHLSASEMSMSSVSWFMPSETKSCLVSHLVYNTLAMMEGEARRRQRHSEIYGFHQIHINMYYIIRYFNVRCRIMNKHKTIGILWINIICHVLTRSMLTTICSKLTVLSNATHICMSIHTHSCMHVRVKCNICIWRMHGMCVCVYIVPTMVNIKWMSMLLFYVCEHSAHT